MSGYSDNAHDTMQGFFSIMMTTKLPRYYPSRLTSCVFITPFGMGMKKRDRASINDNSKYKSLNARWFTKVGKTPTPMTGDILELDVTIELKDPGGSISLT